jgi:hypothetical protein
MKNKLKKLEESLTSILGENAEIFLALVETQEEDLFGIENVIPSDKEIVIPSDKKENVIPSDKKENVIPSDKKENVIPSDKKENVIPSDREIVISSDKENVISSDKENLISSDKEIVISSDKEIVIHSEFEFKQDIKNNSEKNQIRQFVENSRIYQSKFQEMESTIQSLLFEIDSLKMGKSLYERKFALQDRKNALQEGKMKKMDNRITILEEIQYKVFIRETIKYYLKIINFITTGDKDRKYEITSTVIDFISSRFKLNFKQFLEIFEGVKRECNYFIHNVKNLGLQLTNTSFIIQFEKFFQEFIEKKVSNYENFMKNIKNLLLLLNNDKDSLSFNIYHAISSPNVTTIRKALLNRIKI